MLQEPIRPSDINPQRWTQPHPNQDSMAHRNLPPSNTANHVLNPCALPVSLEPEDAVDHRRVVVYGSFYDQSEIHAPNNSSYWQPQPQTQSGFPGFHYQPQQSGYIHHDPDVYASQQHFQQPCLPASEPLANSNLPAMINPMFTMPMVDPRQTIIYPLAAGTEPHEQHSFQGGPVVIDQPLPYPVQPNLNFQPPDSESDYPPVYLTTNNVTREPTGSFILVPPAYNYAANHPSSAGSGFLNSLLQGGAHRLACVFMDASSDMWIHACNNVVGKDGPTDLLKDRIFSNAGFQRLLKSPHLQAENCTITVHIADRPGGREIVEKEVPVDPEDKDFLRAVNNELHRIPDRIYEHLWKCSIRLLQPSTHRRGIFSTPTQADSESKSSLDGAMHAKLRWAFTQNDEWGFGIFHEIVEDENGFRPGRWFANMDFINALQEGIFDDTSDGWLGFIDSTAAMNSSWKVTECPTAHLFAVAISWIIVTGRFDFLKIRVATSDWVSNARIEEAKGFTKFLERWFLDFWRKNKGDPRTRSERAEGMAFMLRHGPSPLEAI